MKKTKRLKSFETLNFENRNSEDLVERLKIKSFTWIFFVLDSDEDGLISAQKINLAYLSQNILKILTPLFLEIEEEWHTLNWEEFIEAWRLLYKTLNIVDKNWLLSFSNKQTDQM